MGRESSDTHLQKAFSGTQLELSAPHLSVVVGGNVPPLTRIQTFLILQISTRR